MEADMAEDVTFDAADFQRALLKGVGDGRHAASARASSRSAAAAAAAASAMAAFAAAADDASPSAPDVVAAYLAVSPGAAELFAALWLGAARPAAAAAALDCLLAVARYAASLAAPPAARRPTDPAGLERARSVVKDVVKGRAAALFHILSAAASPASPGLADKALQLLVLVAGSHPMLAKETVNRFDLSSRALGPSLCSKTSVETRRSFCTLVAVLLTCGDRDVLQALATRMRPAIVHCLTAFAERISSLAASGPDGPDLREDDEAALLALLDALENRVLTCPNASVVRSAFEPPILSTIALYAQHYDGARDTRRVGRVCSVAAHLFDAVISNSAQYVTTAHVASVLAQIPVSISQSALSFVIKSIASCPRAARMLLQTGPHVFSTPELSSSWFASAAVICRCVRELRTPSSVFARAKFFEKCWTHEHAIVRHYGILIANCFCRVLLQPRSDDCSGRLFLPPLAVAESLLRKSSGQSVIAHQLYGYYRSLFWKEFDESKSDAVRIAMDAGFGESPCALQFVISSSLKYSREETLATVFHKHVFADLIMCMVRSCESCCRLLESILDASGLFAEGTTHENAVWLQAISKARPSSVSVAQEFEKCISEAWAKPYALFDDVAALSYESSGVLPMSLLSSAALRRLQKARKKLEDEDAAVEERTKLLSDGSLTSILVLGLTFVAELLSSPNMSEIIEGLLQYWRVKPGSSFLTSTEATGHANAVNRSDTPSVLGQLTDARVSDSMLEGMTIKLISSSSSGFPRSGEGLLLFTRLCSLPEGRAVKIISDVLTSKSSDDQTLVFSAVALKACKSASLQRLAFGEACRLCVAMSRDALPTTSLRFLQHEMLAYLRTVEVSSDFSLDLVRQVVESAWPRKSSEDLTFFVQTIHCLTGHRSFTVRAYALQLVEILGSSEVCDIDLTKTSIGLASLLGDIVVVCPIVQNIVVTQVVSQRVDANGLLCLIPALAQILQLSSDDAPETNTELTLSVLKVLLGPGTTTVDSSRAQYDLVSNLNRIFEIVFDRRPTPTISSLVSGFVKIQETHQGSGSFAYPTLSNAVVTALLQCPFVVQLHLKQRLVELVNSLPFADDALSALEMMAKYAKALGEPDILRDVDLHRVERLEKTLDAVIPLCCTHLTSRPVCADIAYDMLQLDLMLTKASEVALVSLSNLVITNRKSLVDSVSLESFARFVAAALKRISRLDIPENLARSLVVLEEFFSFSDFDAKPSAQDTSVYTAMMQLAIVLKSTRARERYSLTENRSGYFDPSPAEVIRKLEPARLNRTADYMERNQAADDEGYNVEFVLSALRHAACEARDSPTSAILDLDFVARGGLTNVALAALSSRDKSIRISAYSALGALTDAVGPVSGVNRDSASALYRDRRQLAFMLNLVKASIRTPLEPVLPLFSTFVRLCLPVLLMPTHPAYREVIRVLLRAPLHDVHDAEAVSSLLAEDNPSCQALALQIVQGGLRTTDDHHIARKRRIYECILTLGSQQPREAAATLRTVASYGNTHVAADLVRSQGVLAWILGSTISETSDASELVGLLKELAENLPNGVLRATYSECFVEVLEDLSTRTECESSVVSGAARAIAKLVPNRRRIFCLGRAHEERDLVVLVYSKRQMGPQDEEGVLKAIDACCQSVSGSESFFPSSPEEVAVVQAFIADAVLQSADLRKCERVKSGLACLLLDTRQILTPWIAAASLCAIPLTSWSSKLHSLADRLPGTVPSHDLRDWRARAGLSVSMRQRLASLLQPVDAVTDGGVIRGRKRRKSM